MATGGRALNPERALAQLSAILQSAEDAIVGSGLGDTILTWNPAAERIFGYSAAEALGRPAGMLVPEDCRAG